MRRANLSCKALFHRRPLFFEALEDRTLLSGLNLTGTTFFGGAGDQGGFPGAWRGTDIAIADDALYVSANGVVAHGPNADALVARFAIPTDGSAPVWSRAYGFGTNFGGVAATGTDVIAAGWNYLLTTDGAGGKEVKSFVADFAADGSDGPAAGGAKWIATPNFFVYSGVEAHEDIIAVVEGGESFLYATGGGQPCSYFAFITAKYDADGNLVTAVTDGDVGVNFNQPFVPAGGGASMAAGITVFNGSVYSAGSSNWAIEDGVTRPVLWKHDADLGQIWRVRNSGFEGSFHGVVGFAGSLYAAGYETSSGSQDFLIQKFDEAGNLIWSTVAGGTARDLLNDVIAIDGRLFAVGSTKSEGSGGADTVVLEIDPATGNILSKTLFGGPNDDLGHRAATHDGQLYIVGESRSFASDEGNAVGQNDVMLLRYALEPAVQTVEIDVKPGSDPNSVNLSSNGMIAVALFTTDLFDASKVDVTTVVFAGANAVHSAMEDVDGDGDLDMVLHFRTQDTNLQALYEELLANDLHGDGILDSTRQEVEVSLTGETVDKVLFEGFDELELFLSGKHLRNLLEELATVGAI